MSDKEHPNIQDFLDEEEVPELPEVQQKRGPSALDKSRICQTCGNEGRVVSNQWGVNVHCGHCKTSWPVSGARQPDSRLPLSAPRGLSKQTRVAPDVSIAFEPDEE